MASREFPMLREISSRGFSFATHSEFLIQTFPNIHPSSQVHIFFSSSIRPQSIPLTILLAPIYYQISFPTLLLFSLAWCPRRPSSNLSTWKLSQISIVNDTWNVFYCSLWKLLTYFFTSQVFHWWDISTHSHPFLLTTNSLLTLLPGPD